MLKIVNPHFMYVKIKCLLIYLLTYLLKQVMQLEQSEQQQRSTAWEILLTNYINPSCRSVILYELVLLTKTDDGNLLLSKTLACPIL